MFLCSTKYNIYTQTMIVVVQICYNNPNTHNKMNQTYHFLHNLLLLS